MSNETTLAENSSAQKGDGCSTFFKILGCAVLLLIGPPLLIVIVGRVPSLFDESRENRELEMLCKSTLDLESEAVGPIWVIGSDEYKISPGDGGAQRIGEAKTLLCIEESKERSGGNCVYEFIGSVPIERWKLDLILVDVEREKQVAHGTLYGYTECPEAVEGNPREIPAQYPVTDADLLGWLESRWTP